MPKESNEINEWLMKLIDLFFPRERGVPPTNPQLNKLNLSFLIQSNAGHNRRIWWMKKEKFMKKKEEKKNKQKSLIWFMNQINIISVIWVDCWNGWK